MYFQAVPDPMPLRKSGLSIRFRVMVSFRGGMVQVDRVDLPGACEPVFRLRCRGLPHMSEKLVMTDGRLQGIPVVTAGKPCRGPALVVAMGLWCGMGSSCWTGS